MCFYEPLSTMLHEVSRTNACFKALEDISKLVDDTQTADVVLEAEGQLFYVHSAVVCKRCTYIAKLLEFHSSANKHVVLQGLSAAAFRVVYQYLYCAEMPLFPSRCDDMTCDTPRLESVILGREVLMTADKWGLDELYQHLLKEFKRELSHATCSETLAWSIMKGTPEASKIALEFFVQHRHQVKAHSADTLELLKVLDNEQMHNLLVQLL